MAEIHRLGLARRTSPCPSPSLARWWAQLDEVRPRTANRDGGAPCDRTRSRLGEGLGHVGVQSRFVLLRRSSGAADRGPSRRGKPW